ncbi:MAG TPA: response regulator [Thermoanaerobaculia bacterium]|nr:response regulator [Thermoanaerobaculia bacterium]
MCVSCGKPYDAEKAAECSCIQPVRSIRCPNCAACFCKDKKKLDAFWREATPEMWQRRRAATTPAHETAAEIRRPLVLFADDDPTGRAIATRVIQNLGYGIITAANGEEALALAREHRPELIITDALMPRLDGRDMGKLVKSELPRTKLVVITSVYKDPRYKHEALKTFGVDEYLPKPISPAALRDVVTKHLR